MRWMVRCPRTGSREPNAISLGGHTNDQSQGSGVGGRDLPGGGIHRGRRLKTGRRLGNAVGEVEGPYSVELCGGTHVSRTGDIAVFVITSEGGVAQGVRRIEAATGAAAGVWRGQVRAACRQGGPAS